MNHIFTITKNNLALSQRAIESFRQQDIPVKLHVYDNLSTDGTVQWLSGQSDIIDHSAGEDLGVSAAWNLVLDKLFYEWNAEHVLVANNDVALPNWIYSELLSYLSDDQLFITGVASDDESVITALKPSSKFILDPHPDFSLFLIKKHAYQKIGHFDEDMILYASDCDYHVRGHRLGVGMYKVAIPYYHVSSSTLRLAPDSIRNSIHQQANADREVFRKKYGTIPGEEAYGELFK